ncbi:MAG: SDR family oxidoreductase [Spirosomataceae bacterium]
MKISILGCGWLGFPLAQSLEKQGHKVKGSTTRPEKLSELRQAGIEPLWLQLTPEPKGIGWDYLLDCDALVINIPPRLEKAGADFHPAQMRYLVHLIKNSSVKQVIYISSTSVYPDLNRQVKEEDVLSPVQSAFPALVEVEQLIQELPQSTLILRCGGLMGYERIPAKYVAGKKDMTTGDIPVNYIHRDDVIGIIEAFLQNPVLWDAVYNAVAPLHPTRRDVYLASCAPFGYAPPTFKESGANPFKIISSQKLQSALSYRFVYPNPVEFLYRL